MCRRAGEKLFLKGERCFTPKCGVVRKSSPPGMHGAKKSRRSQSEYAQQLAMKQRIKRMYVILERQLKKYFEESRNRSGMVGDVLLQKIEMRLDNALYRAGLASSRRQARQISRHSSFLVNQKSVNIPSYGLKAGDVITIKENKKNKKYFSQMLSVLKEKKGAGVPGWLKIDPENASVEIVGKPVRDDFESGIDAQMVVEYYSR